MPTSRYIAPGIQRRYRKLYAIQEVPKGLRKKIGRVRFVQSLDTDSLQVAKRRAAVLIADWKAQIEAARDDKPVDDAAFFQRALKRARTPKERARALRDIETEADNLASYSVGHGPGIEPQDVQGAAQLAHEKAVEFVKVATGQKVMLADHIEPWLATTELAPKTLDSARKELTAFAKLYPSVDDITKDKMQEWVNDLSTQIVPNTLRKRLAHLRNLWRYLQRQKLAPASEPFHGLDIPKRPKNGNGKRRPFAKEDIKRLFMASDGTMRDLIVLATYTGCRIEELCSLKVEDVTDEAFRITKGKNENAIRDIPIHSAIKPVVKRLKANSRDGYLLSGLNINKHGQRSHNIGRNLGNLKAKLGYDKTVNFHSIRKTVATMFEEAGIQEVIAARILGHELKTMSYTAGKITYQLFGKTYTARNAKVALVDILKEMETRHNGFYDELSRRVQGTRRNHIARQKEQVYPGRPDLAETAIEISPGWWIGINIANREKKRILMRACEVLEIRFGKDLVIDLPNA